MAICGKALNTLKGKIPSVEELSGFDSAGTASKCKICEPTEWGKKGFTAGGCLNCESHTSECCHVTIAKQVFGDEFEEGLPANVVFDVVRKLYPFRKRFGKNTEREDAQREKTATYYKENPPPWTKNATSGR